MDKRPTTSSSVPHCEGGARYYDEVASVETKPIVSADIARLVSRCPGCEKVLTNGTTAGWVAASMARYGMCGVGVSIDGEAQLLLLVAPSRRLPANHPLTGIPHTAIVVGLHVGDIERAQAVHAVRWLAGRLIMSRVLTLESLGTAGIPTCTLPSALWLVEQGFHRVGPLLSRRYRLDLATMILTNDLEIMREKLRGFLPYPVPHPEPGGSYRSLLRSGE